MRTALTAALTCAACAALRHTLEGTDTQDAGPVRVRPLRNRGAAFGLPIPPAAIPPLSLAALAAVLPRRRKHPFAVGLILGGGLSNLWERTRQGSVLDYLQFPGAPGPIKRYVYNLADLALFAGTLGLLRKPRGVPPKTERPPSIRQASVKQ